MKAKILWIEGKRSDNPSFIQALGKKGHVVETVASGQAALAYISEKSPDLVVINAASMRTSGSRICQDIRERMNGLPIVLIANPGHPPTSRDACAHVVLNKPFTAQKLVNRIIPLLPSSMENLIHAGPIQFDQVSRRVRCLNKEARLTPRLARLLKMLMDHSGEVIERETLFREVWKTEYTEDTRTLDVHISWLRLAIEEDPRAPRFLKTLRGVGYRLDV
jgi:DNA-binding response OmpR family regulator